MVSATFLPYQRGLSAGRLASLAQGPGAAERAVTFAYDPDGNLARVTDPLLRTVAFAYDAAGRVTRQTLPDGRAIDFTYDSRGNLTSLTPPGQPAHVFRYTARDQESEYEPPPVDASDPRTFFTYDLDKNLTQVDRPDGAQILLGYDGAGRLATVTTPRGTTTQSYDPATGNLAQVTAPGGETLTYGYDGSLVTSTSWSGTVNGAVSQSYDDDFRVASQTVAGSTTETFVYDDDGLLTAAGPMTLGRDPLNGLLTSTTVGTVATSQGYNGFGELASDAAQVGAGTAYSNTYTRDALGRITHKTETLQGTTTTYAYHYDGAGRLVQVDEDGAPARTYAYDANGNRLALTDHTDGGTLTTGSYDAQDRLESYGDFTYTYDGNGDLTSKTDTATGETTHYVYDALGNLVQADLPDGRTLTYVIDGQNRRIGKKVDGALVQAWLYQDQLNPVAELDGSGNVVARFVYGSRPNVPDLMIRGGQTYRILADHLGSPRLVVNAATGAVAQRLDYDEWGQVTEDTNPGFQPFGFAGGLYDQDAGLVRFGARDYDPEVGRWTRKDPLRAASGSANLYGYALLDPLNFSDSGGEKPRASSNEAGGTSVVSAARSVSRFFGGVDPACIFLGAASGLSPFGNLAKNVAFSGAGAFTAVAGTYAATAGALAAGSGVASAAAAGAAVAATAGVAGAALAIWGTTNALDQINESFGTDVPTLSNTPGPLQSFFPDKSKGKTKVPGCSCE